jgi:hypothetical protein
MSLRNIATYIAAVIIGCFIVEAGCRIQLLRTDPRIRWWQERVDELPEIDAYTRSLWHFNPEEGFDYSDRTGIFIASVVKGRIALCGAINPLNEEGSPGISEGRYEDADFKIAVFGNSFNIFVDI